MRIGFYTYGNIFDESFNVVQKNNLVDATFLYRKMSLEWIKNQGHEIYLMNERRDWKRYKKFDSVKDSKMFSPSNLFKTIDWTRENNSIKLELSWQNMYEDIDKVNWPKLDMLIIDNAAYPFMPVITYKLMLILAYKDKIPVIVLDDDDHTLPILNRADKVLGTHIQDDIFVATRFKKQVYRNQLFNPFPYFEEYERDILPVDKLEHEYVYVGHDYDRRQKMIKFYFDIAKNYSDVNVEVYGNWDKWLKTKRYCEKYPKDVFKGTIAPSAAFDLWNKSLCSAVIGRPVYEETGQITPRMVEATMCGTAIIADKDIYTIDDYVLKDNIVSTTEEVYNRIEFFKKQSFEDRKEMIEEQRRVLREKLNINEIFSNMLNEVFKK